MSRTLQRSPSTSHERLVDVECAMSKENEEFFRRLHEKLKSHKRAREEERTQEIEERKADPQKAETRKAEAEEQDQPPVKKPKTRAKKEHKGDATVAKAGRQVKNIKKGTGPVEEDEQKVRATAEPLMDSVVDSGAEK